MRRLTVSDRAVFLPDADALVLADVHVGRAAASDVDFPLGEGADVTGRVASLCEAFAPGEVVFAGDVLHRFDRVSNRDASAVRDLEDACRDAGSTPVFVAGNHDTMLDEVVAGETRDEYRLSDGTLVSHGHREPAGDADFHVVGHDHPTIDIEGRTRPCALFGPATFRGADVLMLPAFTRLAAGVTVNRMRSADFQSPLVTDADALRPLVYDADADETLAFPALGRLRRLL